MCPAIRAQIPCSRNCRPDEPLCAWRAWSPRAWPWPQRPGWPGTRLGEGPRAWSLRCSRGLRPSQRRRVRMASRRTSPTGSRRASRSMTPTSRPDVAQAADVEVPQAESPHGGVRCGQTKARPPRRPDRNECDSPTGGNADRGPCRATRTCPRARAPAGNAQNAGAATPGRGPALRHWRHLLPQPGRGAGVGA